MKYYFYIIFIFYSKQNKVSTFCVYSLMFISEFFVLIDKSDKLIYYFYCTNVFRQVFIMQNKLNIRRYICRAWKKRYRVWKKRYRVWKKRWDIGCERRDIGKFWYLEFWKFPNFPMSKRIHYENDKIEILNQTLQKFWKICSRSLE